VHHRRRAQRQSSANVPLDKVLKMADYLSISQSIRNKKK
jgi:hypothetical protein